MRLEAHIRNLRFRPETARRPAVRYSIWSSGLRERWPGQGRLGPGHGSFALGWRLGRLRLVHGLRYDRDGDTCWEGRSRRSCSRFCAWQGWRRSPGRINAGRSAEGSGFRSTEGLRQSPAEAAAQHYPGASSGFRRRSEAVSARPAQSVLLPPGRAGQPFIFFQKSLTWLKKSSDAGLLVPASFSNSCNSSRWRAVRFTGVSTESSI